MWSCITVETRIKDRKWAIVKKSDDLIGIDKEKNDYKMAATEYYEQNGMDKVCLNSSEERLQLALFGMLLVAAPAKQPVK